MRLKSGQPLNLTELCRRMFPHMSPQAFHLWMTPSKQGRPAIFEPEGTTRGRYGYELSFSDAVTIGVMHSLFRLGATFHGFLSQGDEVDPEVLAGRAIENRLILVDPADLESADRIARGRRPMQRFLERHNYKCHVYYEVVHLRDEDDARWFSGRIYLFPSRPELLDNYFEKVRNDLTFIAYGFVNCWTWHQAAKRALEIDD